MIGAKTHYDELTSYLTKDGSIIRELMHPAEHGDRRQSLAEAIIEPGQQTIMHRHQDSEELYHITAGQGLMTLGAEQFTMVVGDTVCIPPGTAHCIRNTGAAPLKILCCCAPAYRHEDTELIECK